MKKMVDKDELEFLRKMKEKGGYESQLKDFDMDEFRNSNVPANMGADVPEPSVGMSERKAKLMMKAAGEDLRDQAAKTSPRMKALSKLGSIGRKAAGVLGPVLGLGAALSSGDATAAVPILGSAESAGMSSQDENQMIAETKAKMDYEKSPAKRDRMAALAKLAELQRK